MVELGQWIIDLLTPLGVTGVLLAVFLLFYIDAIIFPTVPEIFTILFFMTNPTPLFAIEILIMIAFAEVLGLTTLWLICKKMRIPKKIDDVLNRYTKFLIVQDEKIILLNRIAPVLPFMGAFVAVCNWSYKKSVLYTVVSGTLKYGILLLIGQVFVDYLESDMATIVMLVLVLAIIAISLIFSYRRKRKMMCQGSEPGV